MLAAASLFLSSQAFAAEIDFSCAGPEGSSAWKEGGVGIIAVPPLDIQCTAILPEDILSDGVNYSEISWTVGDGTTLFGETIIHRYEEEGQFTISIQLEDYEPPANSPWDETDAKHTRYGFVTMCGPPQPQFTFTNKGGLDYQLINQSNISLYCLETSEWEVYRGESASGVPVFRFDTWEPRFELPEEDIWTIRLVQNGYAGKRYADATFEARFQLTDDLTEGPRAFACSTLSTHPSFGWLFVGSLALFRATRRR